MRQFSAFVIKEFYHIFRDRRTMLILLGMPVIQIILFGFAITTEVKNVRIAIFDPSKDRETQKITEQLDANEYLYLTTRLESAADIETVFLQDKADVVITFSDHFGDNLLHTGDAAIQIIADGTEPNTATILTGYISTILTAVQHDGITPEVKLLYNPGMKGAYNFVPGVMGLILLLLCAMMTSISIVREKEMGTMEILLVSPIRPLFIILAKTIPYLTLSCINLVTILLLSVYVLDVPMAGSLFWLFAISFLFILVSLALGLLISTVTKTQLAAMLASGMVLMMPVIILSGMMFPVENMPIALQGVSHLIPAKWYIMAVKKIMIEGLDISFVLKEAAILACMAVLLLVVSIKKFNNRLE